MQFKKILVSLGVLLCFCTSFSAVAYADMTTPFPDYGISVLYEIANYPESMLSITDGTAYCISSTTGTNTVSITVTQTLQKQGFLWIWGTYDGAKRTKTVYTSSMSMSNTKTSLSSGKYRVKTVFKLTDKQGETETITTYSDTKSV